MFRHWLKFLFRSRRRHQVFTVINITGFAFGLVSAFSIFLYVIDELSFDKFHSSYDQVYRVTTANNFGGDESKVPFSTLVLTDASKLNHPDLPIARIFLREAQLGTGNGELFKEEHFGFADADILKIFSFKILVGDARQPLSMESSAIISKSLAEKLFTSPTLAIGKTITIENKLELTVQAVYADWPEQSHLRVNMISHFNNYLLLESESTRNYLKSDWLFTSVSTYVLLNGQKRDQVELMLNNIKARFADERVKSGIKFELQPLKDIHLYSDFAGYSGNNQIFYVYIFSLIGMLILFMACINFINLSLATSIQRFKEISIRKILGAGQRKLIVQFMVESFSYVLISVLLAFTVTYLLLPKLNVLMDKNIAYAYFLNPYFVAALVLTYLVSGSIAGVIPGVLITKVNPVLGVKGYVSNKFKGIVLIKPLVITQFVISSVLILFMFVIDGQIQLFKTNSLGFQKDHMVNIPLFMQNLNTIFGGVDGPLRVRMNSFENALLENPSIEAVTVSSSLPGEGAILGLLKTDEIKGEDNVFVASISVDYDFIDTYRIPVLAGRSFSASYGTDHLDAYVINQETRKLLKFKTDESAIGQAIEHMDKKGKIIGVVQDFNFQGLQESVSPLIMEVNPAKFTVFSMRLNNQVGLDESIQAIENTWTKLFPERFFEFSFLDESFNQNYTSQFRLSETVKSFTAIASLISMIGLFGLTAYTSTFYLKEISIRKISGASQFSIISLLFIRQFRILLYATLVGFPIGFWLCRLWLSTFAYRISLTWDIFAITYLTLSGLLILATFFHFLKSAKVNPLDVIRSE
jgi:putative ABC transport system permease protein